MRGDGNIKMKGKRTIPSPCGCCSDFVNGKIELALSKLQMKKEIKKGTEEVFSSNVFDMSHEPIMKEMFPGAKSIVCCLQEDGHIFVYVDGKFKTTYENITEMMSYSYHTGCQYKDYDDLKEKYLVDLRAAIGKSGFYLP